MNVQTKSIETNKKQNKKQNSMMVVLYGIIGSLGCIVLLLLCLMLYIFKKKQKTQNKWHSAFGTNIKDEIKHHSKIQNNSIDNSHSHIEHQQQKRQKNKNKNKNKNRKDTI